MARLSPWCLRRSTAVTPSLGGRAAAGVATHRVGLCTLSGPNTLTIGSVSLWLTQIKAGPGKPRQRYTLVRHRRVTRRGEPFFGWRAAKR